MANKIAPRLLRRGLELFALISLLGFGAMLLYGNNLQRFIQAMVTLEWGWVLVGVLLASHDWWGGGLRAWVVARHVHLRASLKGCVLAGGMATWAAYLTPSQTGSGPMLIYTMNRYGIPLPEAMISTLMTFVATVLFFTVAGPLAVFLGAGQSLAEHGVLGQTLTLNDLFRMSLGGFIGVGFLILLLISFPGLARRIAQRLVRRLKRRGSESLAARVVAIEDGIDRAHQALVAFTRGRGWIALAIAVVLTGAAQANRLLAGYVVLRMLDIHAPFVDVLLLQTLIVFLLYFAPTPGGSGLAELLSAAVMSIYVPRELTPSYILLWRIVVSYLTVTSGSFVFWKWLKGAESGPANSLPQQEIPQQTE
ncbi:MAG: flippase-like domain-containing protein [Gemmatimonadota bacterium]|nr:MAG: flippase-like domain-containing protein [Gemmatimonadota bacterium]